MTLAQLITDMVSVLNTILTNVATTLSTALSSPVVILFLGCAFAGVVIGFGKKLLHF